MHTLAAAKDAATDTSGGKLTSTGDGMQSDETYLYAEVMEETIRRLRTMQEASGSGDKQLQVPMRKSLFTHVPPYVIFSTKNDKPVELPPEIRDRLTWKYDSRSVPKMIRLVLIASGFRISRKVEDWCGVWSGNASRLQLKSLKSFQKVNFFPGAFQLSHKDLLATNIYRMTQRCGQKEFDFVPTTYVFPRDKRRFRRIFEKHGGLWIVKPPVGCAGYGIKLASRWSDIPNVRSLVVQRYLTKPRLIQGLKFDMRLYVLVTSIHPLLVYLYSEGLVRFATVKYDRDVRHLRNKYMHLTNTSINKSSPRFVANDSLDRCKGHMWSLNSLWSYLGKNRNTNISDLWDSIKDLVMKTLISAEAFIVDAVSSASGYNFYQLFGFDVILDSHLKPWLLEVNNLPSMEPDTPLCSIVKGELARDMLNVLGFQLPDSSSPNQRGNGELDGDRICHDNRLYSLALTRVEEEKHARFANVANRQDYLQAILDDLTPDDVRHLIRYEDQITQIGRFEKIFPTKATHVYHKLFARPRYYNKLFDAWENSCGSNRSIGISRLRKLCETQVHLSSTTLDPVR